MIDLITTWKSNNQTIVFTNGCFDIIHPGHISYLKDASKLGDKLVVGLNSDSSVQTIKGPKRPINNEYFRRTLLESIRYVDLVLIFNAETPIELIKFVKPDILCKGGDYSIEQIVGWDFMEEIGGQTLSLPFKNGFSSSQIIDKIRAL